MVPSFEAAVQEAVIAARAILAAEVATGRICLGCHIEIADVAGVIFAKVPFNEVLEVRGGKA